MNDEQQTRGVTDFLFYVEEQIPYPCLITGVIAIDLGERFVLPYRHRRFCVPDGRDSH